VRGEIATSCFAGIPAVGSGLTGGAASRCTLAHRFDRSRGCVAESAEFRNFGGDGPVCSANALDLFLRPREGTRNPAHCQTWKMVRATLSSDWFFHQRGRTRWAIHHKHRGHEDEEVRFSKEVAGRSRRLPVTSVARRAR
jgi:hypothetical protein